MPDLTVVGAQWGDEGKGKVVDCLSRTARLVVRYQGGPNAGHTVRARGRETILHQVPSGILSPGAKCVIGCGCVVDPELLAEELAGLARAGVRTRGRLVVDGRAHLIMRWHRRLDRLREERAGAGRIGTTGRGIGPVSTDKVDRVGIRAADLLDEDAFQAKFKRNLAAANWLLMEKFRADPIPQRRLMADCWQATRPLAAMVGDGGALVNEALENGRRVLFEGAQGVHLDIDLGTYPYVTCSSTGVNGVASGVGVSPLWLTEAVGVVKAYTTRVGEGPFPTELAGAEGDTLRVLGGEFGATTGRARRCGWFDAGLVRSSVRYNRFTALALTKLDVLDSLVEIPLATGYRLRPQAGETRGGVVEHFDATRAARLEPLYETMTGWRTPTGHCRSWRELPLAARRYVRRLEELVECPVALVSIGSDREQIIEVKKGALQWLKSG
ncbi:MAG TPA: adenylosuccinate synthase [candidate division WOR-3 bacterium]|uniref:Adenylosuccinate synthetase n=1 Tax=candidate division WOR-3 bacterium TaxID=2052148 RepID=A0A7V0T5F4_UNCW3|nr:adenylosuccinate synthase [candidate division WOR-3 bacterium]